MPNALPSPLSDLLQQASRTFYRTLRILPAAVRPQISLAYLLARTSDTIADTEIIPLEARLRALQQLRVRILGTGDGPLEFGELARQQSLPAERALLAHCEASLAALRELSVADAQLVRIVLDTITSGQELDLRRFHAAAAERIVALQTDAELDDYTYRVAGCVGEFWTRICLAHVFELAELDGIPLPATFEGLGVRFGKGLQLVNILRDLPADLHKGRCYLPEEKISKAGLKPEDLSRAANMERLRPCYHDYLNRAESHLAAGWEYTNLIPFACWRLRLACAWPILIGLETIKRLRVENVLDPQRRVKISRADVRRLISRSVLCYPWPTAWKRMVMATLSTSGGGGSV